jgi:addiction module RelE/StbE family toxin
VGYEVIMQKRAIKDFDDIIFYLSLFYPSTPEKFVAKFEQGVNVIAETPYLFPLYGLGQYRRFIVNDYLVFYKVFETQQLVKICRIIHGSRNIPSTLS